MVMLHGYRNQQNPTWQQRVLAYIGQNGSETQKFEYAKNIIMDPENLSADPKTHPKNFLIGRRREEAPFAQDRGSKFFDVYFVDHQILFPLHSPDLVFCYGILEVGKDYLNILCPEAYTQNKEETLYANSWLEFSHGTLEIKLDNDFVEKESKFRHDFKRDGCRLL